MDGFGPSEATGLAFWFLLFYISWWARRWTQRRDEKNPKPDLDERGPLGEKMHGEGPAWEQDTPWVLDIGGDEPEDEPQIQEPSETIVMVMPYREDDDL